MINKNNKFIKYASMALLAVVAVAASLSSNNINLGKNLLRGRATEAINGTINFVNTGSNVTLKSNSYYFLSASTQTGQTIYLRNYCTGDYQSGYIATLSSGSEITFSSDNSIASPVHFGFQKITSIYARTTSSNSRLFEVSTSSDGITYSNSSDFYVSNAGQTFNFGSSGAQYIKITYSSFLQAIIDEFSISYTCSSIEPEPVKTLDSIEVKTAPSTLDYTEGDTFDPTGLVITATYDDESTEDIEYEGNEGSFTFSPSLSTELSTEDVNITITYGGKSCSQSIAVEEEEESFIGKYSAPAFKQSGVDTTFSIVFETETSGYYERSPKSGSDPSSATISFTCVINHLLGTITFTKPTESTTGQSAFGSYRIFPADTKNSQNTTGIINSDGSITVSLYMSNGNVNKSLTFYK